jgi:hypothetical protein
MFSAVFIIAGMPHGIEMLMGDPEYGVDCQEYRTAGPATNRSRAARLNHPGAFRFHGACICTDMSSAFPVHIQSERGVIAM